MDLRVALAIVDQFGMTVQIDRMDGASPMSPDVAEAKAMTALNFQRSTDEVARLDRDVVKMINEVVSFQIVAEAGGAPILSGSDVRGAVGVSGATPQQEHEIAVFVATGVPRAS
jgi:glc operon protein GlcG